MKRLSILIAGCMMAVMTTGSAQAIYFTLQLKNGNEIITDKYTVDNNTIVQFYTDDGSVVIPRSIVKSIRRSDIKDIMQSDDFEQQEFYMEGLEEEEPTTLSPASSLQNTENLNAIKDQLAVIDANLDNLSRNKIIYESQKAQYEEQKQRAAERLEKLRKDAETESLDYGGALELEESRLKDIDLRLQDLDQRIANNEKMADAQQRMKDRIQEELAAKKQ